MNSSDSWWNYPIVRWSVGRSPPICCRSVDAEWIREDSRRSSRDSCWSLDWDDCAIYKRLSREKASNLTEQTFLGIVFPRDLSVPWRLNSIAVRRSLGQVRSLSYPLRPSKVLWWSRDPESVPNDVDTEHRCDYFRHSGKCETNLSPHHWTEWNPSSVRPRREKKHRSNGRVFQWCRSHFVFGPFLVGLLSRRRSSFEYRSILFVIRVIIRAATSTATCSRW